MKSLVVKRSIVIGRHRTSVSLEDAFWSDLKEIARAQEATVSKVVTQIDGARQKGNLSSAIRFFFLERICKGKSAAYHQPPHRLKLEISNHAGVVHLSMTLSVVAHRNLRAAILSSRLLSRHKRTRYIHRCARTRDVRLPRFAKEASAHRSSDIAYQLGAAASRDQNGAAVAWLTYR